MRDNFEQLNSPDDPLEQIPTLDGATTDFSLDAVAGVIMDENRKILEQMADLDTLRKDPDATPAAREKANQAIIALGEQQRLLIGTFDRIDTSLRG